MADQVASDAASRLVGELLDLPAFPPVLGRLLEMTEDDRCDLPALARVIEQDQALAAKILRVANSAMFGCKRQIRTIQHAAAMLGLENIRKYALTVAVFGTRARADVADYEARRRTWLHAMAVAVLARLLGTRFGCLQLEAAVAAGLIHDIGRVVLDILRPGEAEHLTAVARTEHLDTIGAERRLFGTDHCALGAELGCRWNLPPDLVDVLGRHHDPTVVQTAEQGRLSALHLVHVANFLCHTVGLTSQPNAPTAHADFAGWARVGLALPDLVGLLGEVERELAQSLDYFDLGPINLAEYCDLMDESGRRIVELGLESEDAQRHLRRRLLDLSAVADGVLSLGSDAKVGEVLASVAAGALGQLDFDRVVVYTVAADHIHLDPVAVHGQDPTTEGLPVLSLLQPLDPVVGAALRGRTAVLRAGRDFQSGQSDLLDTLAPESCAVVPLRADGRTYGLVIVDNAQSGLPVSEPDAAVLTTIGKQISLALDRAAAYEKLQERAEELEDLAFRDPLTELHNLRYLEESLDLEIQRAERYERPFSVLMLDVDHFKRVNDTYGHPVGDEVLRMVARVAREHLRDSDVLFRYGGEEFTALLPDTPKDRAGVPAENVRKAIEAASLDSAGETIRVTVSIGVASFPDDAHTRASLIGFADDALYRAKTMGRNRVVSAGKE